MYYAWFYGGSLKKQILEYAVLKNPELMENPLTRELIFTSLTRPLCLGDMETFVQKKRELKFLQPTEKEKKVLEEKKKMYEKVAATEGKEMLELALKCFNTRVYPGIDVSHIFPEDKFLTDFTDIYGELDEGDEGDEE